jgi:hypothetical protein
MKITIIKAQFIICLILIATISCKNQNAQKDSNRYSKYYLLHLYRGEHIDTLTNKDAQELFYSEEEEFKLKIIDSVSFKYKTKSYTIRKLSNSLNAPVDAGHQAFWEKGLGFFYWKSLTWRNFVLLRTDNDSINQFIEVLLGNIILDPRLSNPFPMQGSEFINPSVLDSIE